MTRHTDEVSACMTDLRKLKGLPSTTMDYDLNVIQLIRRSAVFYSDTEIVSRLEDGIFRYNYGSAYERIGRIGAALRDQLGVKPGDIVGVLGWNTHRFLELYFAIPSIGAVCHELNLRLSLDELSYIIDHAQDKILILDPDLIQLVEKLKEEHRIPSVESFIILADGPIQTKLSPVFYYERLIRQSQPIRDWPMIDERSAATMCYTTGTTGKPKGVLYSHRALVVHALDLALHLGLSSEDVILPVASMFHANGWMMPYVAPLVGAKLVLPGPRPRPAQILELILSEGVTVATGVPTVWMDLLEYIKSTGRSYDLSGLRIVCGGSEPPLSLMKAYHEVGAEMIHAYGMTEDCAVTVVCKIKRKFRNLPEDQIWELKRKQGLPDPLYEFKVIAQDGSQVPWDGKTPGELVVRGPYVTGGYYKDPERSREALTQDGWLRTGDIVVVDQEGYIKLVDRAKDLIKSGGEWISSVDLENAIMAHPMVAEAAVIAIPHPRWGERPLAIVKLKDEYQGKISEHQLFSELKELLLSKGFAKWQLPDGLRLVDHIPKTSVGKFDKKLMRKLWGKG